MECPKCGSKDTHLCSVAHRRGVTERETATSGRGASGHDAARPELDSVTKTQTQLSKDAAPPHNAFVRARGIMIALIIAYVVIRVLALAAGIGSLGIFGPIMVIVILGTAVWLFISYPQRPEYQESRAKWEQSWICSRCGTKFVP